MFARYRPLLSLPGAWALLNSSLAARLPLSTSSLTVLLVIHAATHSFGYSGAASGVLALTQACVTPILGRLLDRHNLVAVIGPTAVLQAVSLIALVVCAKAHAPIPLLILICAVIGGSIPPVAAAARMMWGRMVDTLSLRDTAFALDSAGQEIGWTIGPALVGVLVASWSANTAALVVAVMSFMTMSWFLSMAWKLKLADATASARKQRGSELSIRDPRTAGIITFGVLFGIMFGALQVAFPALATHLGSTGLSGLLLAVWSIGSMIGGIAFGTREWTLRPDRMMRLLFLTNAALSVPVAFATSSGWAVCGCVLAGVMGAPVFSYMTTLTANNTPPNALGEAFTWNTASVVCGSAIGAALAGIIASRYGATAAVLASVAVGCVAGAVTFLTGEFACGVREPRVQPRASAAGAAPEVTDALLGRCERIGRTVPRHGSRLR